MPKNLVVQQPSTYERVRRRSNALLLSLDPRPIPQNHQDLREASNHGSTRVTVNEVSCDDGGTEPQDVFTAAALMPPPRSPTSGALIMPLPPGCEGMLAPVRRSALQHMTLPPELLHAPTPAAPKGTTSRHFGLDVGPTTTRALQACEGYLNAWLQDGPLPEAMAERVALLRKKAEALASGGDDLEVLYNAVFCMTLEHNRLLSVARHAVLEQAHGVPATAGMAPAAQWHVMTQAFVREAESVSAALEVLLNLTETCVIMARSLSAYTQRTGVWAPEPKSQHAPPLLVALHASQRQLLHNLRRLGRDLTRWGEALATQVRLLGCQPPEDIAPGTVFSSLRHLQPLSIDVTLQLPYNAMQFHPQTEAATELRGYVHFVSECLQTAMTYIETAWDTHVARDLEPK